MNINSIEFEGKLNGRVLLLQARNTQQLHCPNVGLQQHNNASLQNTRIVPAESNGNRRHPTVHIFCYTYKQLEGKEEVSP
jgi:hypothetical protein